MDVTGNVVHATAFEDAVAKGELFVTKLLPLGAAPQLTDISSGSPAGGEDMKCRMVTEAPGHPQDARFLHVIEGANGGVSSPASAQLVQSNDSAFDGSVVGNACVMFRKDTATTGDTFSSAGSTHRTGTMHFHHNSVVVNSQRSSTALFSLSEPQAVVKASNNIVHCTQSLGSGITLNLAKYHGSYDLGTNWFRTGLVAGTGDGAMTGFGNAITGNDPLVTWTTGLLDNASSCVNVGTGLPGGAQAVDVQYAPPAGGVVRTLIGPAMDLGATESGGDVSPFAQWLFNWFGSSGNATADPDHDGAENLMEYALGLAPTTNNAAWTPAVTRANGKLVMTVAKDPEATDVVFTIEVSDDLTTWHSGAPFTTTLQNTSTLLQVQDEGSTGRRFIRLRVEH